MIIPGVLASSQKSGYPPPPVAGYRLWLDGTDSSAFTFSSGNVVSSWLDKSGNGWNFSQSSVSLQPIRGTNNLVTFDGSNDRLVAASKFMDDMHNGSQNTFFMVFNPAANGGAFMDSGASGSLEIGFMLYNSSSTNFGIFVARGVAGSIPVSAGNNARQANGLTQLATIRLDADNAAAANRAIFYSNTGAASGTNIQTNPVSTAASTDLPSLGSDGNGGDFFNGSIGEILWYGGDLSTTDREAVRDYLITKWGI